MCARIGAVGILSNWLQRDGFRWIVDPVQSMVARILIIVTNSLPTSLKTNTYVQKPAALSGRVVESRTSNAAMFVDPVLTFVGKKNVNISLLRLSCLNIA